MATSLAATMQLILRTTYNSTGVDLTTPTSVITKSISDTLADGDGADLAESVHSDSITASDSGTTIDVFGGITDVYGTTLSMKSVKALLVYNTSTTTGQYVDVGGSGAGNTIEYLTGDTDKVRVFPNGIVFFWSPGAAADCPSPTAGANDEILITAASGTSPVIEYVVAGVNN